MTQAEIARALAVSKPTVAFHMRQLGIQPQAAFAARYAWDAIRDYYDAGHSAAECWSSFGCSRAAWADAIRRGVVVPRPRREPVDVILSAGRRRCRQHVKQRMAEAGLASEVCEECGIGEWRDGQLALQLHHVNGDGTDNRLTNLRLLCPNCHSQTDTWGGRNKGRRDPTDGGGTDV